MPYVQALEPSWFTVTVLPLMVIIPVRALPVLVSVNPMAVPLPVPDAPEVKLIQGALADAVHEQVLLADTCIGIARDIYGNLTPDRLKVTGQV